MRPHIINSRKITKSPHLRTPPMLAVQRLISSAIKSASILSPLNSPINGVEPRGCDVCNDFGIRFLSTARHQNRKERSDETNDLRQQWQGMIAIWMRLSDSFVPRRFAGYSESLYKAEQAKNGSSLKHYLDAFWINLRLPQIAIHRLKTS